MLAEARKKRGTAMGKKATAKKQLVPGAQIAKQKELPMNLLKLISNVKLLLQEGALANLEIYIMSAAAIAAISLGN
jgi:hypothetical protein